MNDKEQRSKLGMKWSYVFEFHLIHLIRWQKYLKKDLCEVWTLNLQVNSQVSNPLDQEANCEWETQKIFSNRSFATFSDNDNSSANKCKMHIDTVIDVSCEQALTWFWPICFTLVYF